MAETRNNQRTQSKRIKAVRYVLSSGLILIMCLFLSSQFNNWTFASAGARKPAQSSVAPLPAFTIDFVRIQPGTFKMGCTEYGNDCGYLEIPAHTVTITKPFDLGRYEVTQAQWQSIMGTNPSKYQGQDRPVEQINWQDVQEFLVRINELKDGHRYRLPSEAEWEYAARAGRTDEGVSNSEAIAWFGQNSKGSTHPVGQKQPNAWGLYDVQGNVQEFVQDWLAFYPKEPQTDPSGASQGNRHVLRGGSWEYCSGCVRLSVRGYLMADVRSVSSGFRLVREVSP
jgi:formylglycine-generating enzyme required for sulfatase activity